MFVDASALVAILLEESGAPDLAARLESASGPITSPLAAYEAVLAVSRVHAKDITSVEDRVRAFMRDAGIALEPIPDEVATLALQAQARYGKRSGHPARLNMGDCFAYAMAKRHRVPLLYKGDDFALTDLA